VAIATLLFFVAAGQVLSSAGVAEGDALGRNKFCAQCPHFKTPSLAHYL